MRNPHCFRYRFHIFVLVYCISDILIRSEIRPECILFISTCFCIGSRLYSSSLAKGNDLLYSSSPLASLDGFSRSHGDGLYVYNRQCLLVQTFCTNSVAANRTNFFILSKSRRSDDFSHFYFVDIFPTEHVLFVFIFASQGLRSALLIFTLGIVRRIFEVTR
jgi:hypothetical protein